MQAASSDHDYNLVLDSPLGRLGIVCRHNRLVRLDYVSRRMALKPAHTPFEREIATQLAGFFDDPGQCFSLDLDLQGTAFQCRVWRALTRIPAGRTLTYGELAMKLDSGARAVGNACRNNPVSIVVPCHRVVGATCIGGYSGRTAGREIARKQWLLQHEESIPGGLKIPRKAPDRRITTNKQRNLHV